MSTHSETSHTPAEPPAVDTSPAANSATAEVFIEQLYEVDESDGEVGGPTAEWYCEGHVEVEDFVRALVAHQIDNGEPIPAIDYDQVHHLWLYKRAQGGGSWVADFRDVIPGGSPLRNWTAVTHFCAERRVGGVVCAVDDCNQTSGYGRYARVIVERDADYMRAAIYLCRAHQKQFPEPSYRVCMVPVGAVIRLASSDD